MTDYTEDAWLSVQKAGSSAPTSTTVTSGSVAVTNFPPTQPVSGTVTANAGTGTLAVSAASLPLPAGASTDGTDITSPTAMPAGGAGIRGWLSAIWTKLNGTLAVTGTFFQATQPVSIATMPSTPVTGTFFQATQPVSLATNTPDVTDRSARLLGHVTVDSAPTTAVTGTFFQATQPVSGTVTVTQSTAANLVNTATQGPANTVGNAWPVKNTDGTNTATVTAASTAAAAANSGLVVALHPTSPLPAGTAVIGALSANQSVNNAQVNGSAVVTSVTGVQDVMPRKRTGATGLSPNYTASRIASNTTTTITSATGYVQNVLIVVSGAGSAWTIKIQNKEATPKILYPATTAVLGTTQPLNLSEPVLATSGIDIVTAGTTAGTVDVYITYWQ